MRYHIAGVAIDQGPYCLSAWYASKLENNQEDDISQGKGRVKRNEMGI